MLPVVHGNLGSSSRRAGFAVWTRHRVEAWPEYLRFETSLSETNHRQDITLINLFQAIKQKLPATECYKTQINQKKPIIYYKLIIVIPNGQYK